jgi:hypothetical protein
MSHSMTFRILQCSKSQTMTYYSHLILQNFLVRLKKKKTGHITHPLRPLSVTVLSYSKKAYSTQFPFLQHLHLACSHNRHYTVCCLKGVTPIVVLKEMKFRRNLLRQFSADNDKNCISLQNSLLLHLDLSADNFITNYNS